MNIFTFSINILTFLSREKILKDNEVFEVIELYTTKFWKFCSTNKISQEVDENIVPICYLALKINVFHFHRTNSKKVQMITFAKFWSKIN